MVELTKHTQKKKKRTMISNCDSSVIVDLCQY